MKARKSSAIQPQMFQFVDMDELVPKKHILRQLNQALDFSIVHDWVAPLYTERTGRPAADPERMVRLMLLSYLFNHSERELYQLLPMHAGYLWFLVVRDRMRASGTENRPEHPIAAGKSASEGEPSAVDPPAESLREDEQRCWRRRRRRRWRRWGLIRA